MKPVIELCMIVDSNDCCLIYEHFQRANLCTNQYKQTFTTLKNSSFFIVASNNGIVF